MWLIIIFIAIIYYAIHMTKIVGNKKTYAERTDKQMTVFFIVQFICLAFAAWVYSWSHDVSLAGMVAFAQIVFVTPVTLICLPPHNHDDNDDSGTIDWK